MAMTRKNMIAEAMETLAANISGGASRDAARRAVRRIGIAPAEGARQSRQPTRRGQRRHRAPQARQAARQAIERMAAFGPLHRALERPRLVQQAQAQLRAAQLQLQLAQLQPLARIAPHHGRAPGSVSGSSAR